MSIITRVEPRLFRIPLDEVLVDAKHGDHTHFELITVTIFTGDGLSGTGYTYTGGKGGQAVLAMLTHDFAGWLTGQDAGAVGGAQRGNAVARPLRGPWRHCVLCHFRA